VEGRKPQHGQIHGLKKGKSVPGEQQYTASLTASTKKLSVGNSIQESIYILSRSFLTPICFFKLLD
jgi:hypothetical protein